MSHFILNNEDYINLIHNEQDYDKYCRMKEIWESGELAKHASECLEAVIEFDNLRQDLHGQPRHTFLIQNDPNLN